MSSLSSMVSGTFFKRFFLIGLIIVLVLAGLSAGAWNFFKEKQAEIKQEESVKLKDLNSLRSQVRFLQQQVQLYRQYGEKYKDLVKKGIIKQQDRVFWADSMIQMQKALVMPDFTFQFTPEQPLDSRRFSNIKVDKGIFYFSRLNLTMALQQDEDLLRFLNAVNERVSPFYLVDGCGYEMLDGKEEKIEARFNPEEGNMEAQCSLVVFHSHSKIAKDL